MMKYFVIILIIISIGYIVVFYKTKNKITKYLKIIHKVIMFLLIISTITCSTILIFKNNFNSNKYGWAINYIDYSYLHKFSLGDNQKIALIDSGISKFQNIKSTLHTSLLDSNDDDIGHGTMMLSIIKGFNNDIIGIAPNADVLSIKVTNKDGTMKPNSVVDAIQLAIDNKCSIINLSFGTYVYNEDINKIIKEAINKNITVVAAAGDYMHNELLFPASISGVISVGALAKDGKPWHYSNGKDICTILAPGDEIKVMTKDAKIAYTGGTSQSTAITSGYIALLKEYWNKNNITYTNNDIIKVLKNINNKNINYKTPFLKSLKYKTDDNYFQRLEHHKH